MNLKVDPYYTSLNDYYVLLEMVGLKITAKIESNFIVGVDNRIHLDSILAFAVSKIYGYPHKEEIVVIPLPLKCLWVSKNGLPLWGSTQFLFSELFSNISYWHKRLPDEKIILFSKKLSVLTTAGAYKEYRVPMMTKQSKNNELTAYCIGNKKEITKLLEVVNSLGKKGAMGYGIVSTWEIEETTLTEEFILKNRPVPCDFFKKLPKNYTLSMRGAFTPPYHYKPFHTQVITSWY